MAAETSNLSLVTPTQGTLSGTWGSTVNNGITEYTDIAIAGTLVTTGNSPLTLANTIGDATGTNFSTTTAQYAIIRVTATTGAKTITGPSGASYSKTYIVDNTGAYTVTFKAAGQTGVSILAGEKAFLLFNGTDYIKVGSTLPISTVPISSGGTGQTTATAAFDALAPTTTQGDTIYYNGTDNVRLAKGTAGQALVMNSGATAPEWGSAGITTGKAIAMAMIFG